MADWKELVRGAIAYEFGGSNRSTIRCFYCSKEMPNAHPMKRTCWDCFVLIAPKRNKAAYLVYKAVKAGRLPRPRTLTCIDCGKPATCWDHRDYDKPLDVEPVCHACNKARGPALARIGRQAAPNPSQDAATHSGQPEPS